MKKYVLSLVTLISFNQIELVKAAEPIVMPSAVLPAIIGGVLGRAERQHNVLLMSYRNRQECQALTSEDLNQLDKLTKEEWQQILYYEDKLQSQEPYALENKPDLNRTMEKIVSILEHGYGRVALYTIDKLLFCMGYVWTTNNYQSVFDIDTKCEAGALNNGFNLEEKSELVVNLKNMKWSDSGREIRVSVCGDNDSCTEDLLAPGLNSTHFHSDGFNRSKMDQSILSVPAKKIGCASYGVSAVRVEGSKHYPLLQSHFYLTSLKKLDLLRVELMKAPKFGGLFGTNPTIATTFVKISDLAKGPTKITFDNDSALTELTAEIK